MCNSLKAKDSICIRMHPRYVPTVLKSKGIQDQWLEGGGMDHTPQLARMVQDPKGTPLPQKEVFSWPFTFCPKGVRRALCCSLIQPHRVVVRRKWRRGE